MTPITGQYQARTHGFCASLLQLEVAEGQAPALGPDGEVSVRLWTSERFH